MAVPNRPASRPDRGDPWVVERMYPRQAGFTVFLYGISRLWRRLRRALRRGPRR